MSKLVRLTALIGVLVLASGAPAYARGGGGGGHGGGGGGGHFGGGGGHFGGGGGHFGGGHAGGGPHGGFGGHAIAGHHFDGHHGFDGHHFDRHGRVFIGGVGPYWDPYWDPYWAYGPYGAYAYAPSSPTVEAPPVYIEKPQAGYCPSGQANYPGVQSCLQPWMSVAPQAG